MPLDSKQGEIEELPDIDKEFFADKKPGNDDEMHAELASFFDEFHKVNSSRHAVPDFEAGSKVKSDVGLHKRDSVTIITPTRLDSTLSYAELEERLLELFNDLTKELVESFEIDTEDARDAREQLATYVTEHCARQHRTHLFLVYVYFPCARLIRFDRCGALVSQKIDLSVDCTPLIQFYSRFSKMTDTQRGYDPTVKLASDEETKLAQERLKEWEPKQQRPVFKMDVYDDVEEEMEDNDKAGALEMSVSSAARMQATFGLAAPPTLEIPERTHKDVTHIWEGTLALPWPTGDKAVLQFMKKSEGGTEGVMSQEMSGRWVGPCKVADFFKLTMPMKLRKGSKEKLPKIDKKFFAGKKPANKKAMVKKTIEFFGTDNFSGIQLVDTSSRPDPNSNRRAKLRPGLSLRDKSDVIDPNSPTQLGEGGLEVEDTMIEIFSDRGPLFELETDTAQQVRDQLATHAAGFCSRQHRTHLFFIYLYYPYARFIRFDRAGALLSERIDLTLDCTPLIRFFSRFSKMSRVERGYDPTVQVADEFETKLARERLKEWEPKHERPVFKMEEREPARGPDRKARIITTIPSIRSLGRKRSEVPPPPTEQEMRDDMEKVFKFVLSMAWPTDDKAKLHTVRKPTGATGQAPAEGTTKRKRTVQEETESDTEGHKFKKAKSIPQLLGGGPEERKTRRLPANGIRRSTRLHKRY
ncbi:hypothetical protein EYR38_003333 [Pleurotus pulmonarius]|nr:hypothetical protein EYR38_003333 [Pleurotus pulmonarius]